MDFQDCDSPLMNEIFKEWSTIQNVLYILVLSTVNERVSTHDTVVEWTGGYMDLWMDSLGNGCPHKGSGIQQGQNKKDSVEAIQY